jgi:hypothetical protein
MTNVEKFKSIVEVSLPGHKADVVNGKKKDAQIANGEKTAEIANEKEPATYKSVALTGAKELVNKSVDISTQSTANAEDPNHNAPPALSEDMQKRMDDDFNAVTEHQSVPRADKFSKILNPNPADDELLHRVADVFTSASNIPMTQEENKHLDRLFKFKFGQNPKSGKKTQ